MKVTVDAASAARLNAARRAFRALPKDLKNTIRRAQRAELAPIWREEMASAVAKGTPMHAVIFKTGTRVTAGLPVSLVAGESRRQMSGGGSPAELNRHYEFGSGRRERYTRYSRRARGATKATPVERRAGRQLPTPRRNGWVVYPAVSQTIPRLIGSWVNAITERIYDAIDGR